MTTKPPTGAKSGDHTQPIDQLRSHLDRIIDDIAESDRPTVTAWMRWQVLPKLRRDIHQRHIKPSTAANARNTVTSVVAFLFRLAADGRSLAGCRQNDIDAWFAIRQASRHRIRPFLRWSQKHHHLNRSLTLPPHWPRRDQAPADAEHRWDIARRLITDDTLDPADRIAGGLLVLFAQPLARIVALSTTDISHDNGKVTIAFDTNQIELPEPFAALTNQLPHQRRRSTVEQLPTTWLFPGSRAGRHITPTALARRLRRLGIDPRPMRNAALTQLAAELPPTILASTLGITPATAVRWTTLAAGNWTRYAPTNN